MRMNVSKGKRTCSRLQNITARLPGRGCIGTEHWGRLRGRGRVRVRDGMFIVRTPGKLEDSDEWLVSSSKISEPGRPWRDAQQD